MLTKLALFFFLASRMEKASTVRLTKLLRFFSFDTVMSLLALKQNTEIDWAHYVFNDLPFPASNVEKSGVSDDVALRAQRRLRVGES